MKILIVSQYFWPENFKINDFAEGFINRGHKVSVLTGIPNYPTGKYFEGWRLFGRKHELYNGINIYRSFLFPRCNGTSFNLAINYISFAVFASIRALLLKGKYDIIFVYEPSPITVGLPAIILKKLKKLPIIFWVTDLWPESVASASNMKSKLLLRLLVILVKFIYNHSDRILVSSKGFIRSIEEKGISRNKIEYYPQWAEPLFKPIKPVNYLLGSIPEESFKIMFAGNIGESQDFPSVLEAAKLLKKNRCIQWIILGGGRKESWVRSKIEEYQLEECFHLLGSFPLERMPEFYSNADAMLFSLKKEDIFSITIPAKVQSYLACGKPILAMIDGEGALIIDEANAGFTCPAETPKILVKNILRMKELSDVAIAELGKNGRNYYDNNFERNYLLDKAEQLFNSMQDDSSL